MGGGWPAIVVDSAAPLLYQAPDATHLAGFAERVPLRRVRSIWSFKRVGLELPCCEVKHHG
jgi:hypothetical protein